MKENTNLNYSNEDDNLPTLGPYKYKNGATYLGQYLNNMRHGFGRIIYSDGSVYEGNWKKDKASGFGR